MTDQAFKSPEPLAPLLSKKEYSAIFSLAGKGMPSLMALVVAIEALERIDFDPEDKSPPDGAALVARATLIKIRGSR